MYSLGKVSKIRIIKLVEFSPKGLTPTPVSGGKKRKVLALNCFLVDSKCFKPMLFLFFSLWKIDPSLTPTPFIIFLIFETLPKQHYFELWKPDRRTDGPTDGQTDGPTLSGIDLLSQPWCVIFHWWSLQGLKPIKTEKGRFGRDRLFYLVVQISQAWSLVMVANWTRIA